MNINDRIRKARREAELSQHELAKKIGVSVITVFRWESEKVKKVPSEVLSKIAEVTNKPLGYFVSEESEKVDLKREEQLKKELMSDLMQWAQQSSLHKVKALIYFLKSNGS